MADGTLKVGTITTSSGSGTITLGQSGETVTIPSGVTLTNSGTASGFGKVLQVLGATDSTQRSTTSSTFVTGSNTLSVAITPSSTSNKIAIFVNHYAYNVNSFGSYTIYRDATNLGGSDGLAWYNSGSGLVDGSTSYCFLDSPNTTSSITYQPYMKAIGAGSTMYMNKSNLTAQIIVMEIAG